MTNNRFWIAVAWALALISWGSLFLGYSYGEFLVPNVLRPDGKMSEHNFTKMISIIQAFGFGVLAPACLICVKRPVPKALFVPAIIGGSIALGVLAVMGMINVMR